MKKGNNQKHMKREEKKEILQGIQNQIGSFDNKASIFLAAVGIVFALSTSFIDVFHNEWYINLNDEKFKNIYKGFFISFIVVFLFVILAFVLVLWPRKKTINKVFGNYYSDIAKEKRENIDKILDDFSNDDTLLVDQIKINSDICNQKHFFLVAGILLLVPFLGVLSALISMIITK